MRKRRTPDVFCRVVASLAFVLLVALLAPAAAYAQTSSGNAADASRSERADELRQELRRLREDFARSVEEIEARIAALEQEKEQGPDASGPRIVRASREGNETQAQTAPPEEAEAESPSYDGPMRAPQQTDDAEAQSAARDSGRSPYDPGRGIVLARGPLGEAYLGLFGYVRYINQHGLDEFYTDAFGRTFEVDRRQDFQVNRLQLITRGWLFDPRLRWDFWAWTQNVSLGDEAQVVVGGNMTYAFSEALNVQAGIFSLPSTRSTNQSFPNWLRIDHRTMADEYFRASYSTGLLAFGKLSDTLAYSAALANNLSQISISADELDNELNTYSLALWWMPTTGEYGPGAGFGDYEYHEEPATLLGARFTHSREDRQGQPGVNDFENVQLRLSDGTLIFGLDPFDTGGTISRASYAMLDLDAGVKYRGWSFDAEYYFRWVTDFKLIRGTIPVSSLYDHGFQAQISTMLHRNEWQAYASGSKIYGEYGDPWDIGFGLTYFPFSRKEVRMNVQGLYMDRSAVGYTAIPYLVGGNGWVWTVDVGYWF